jgi:PHD/YefM family antitoxin component YafN of YafNO toxin-antitoxin module
MERRGKASDRGDGNREVSVNNEERARLSAEIIDLHAERTRRERRASARREFEASHREVRPDFLLTDRLVAGAVIQSVRRERADIQLRWNDRWRRNELAEKERQAQRQEVARLATIEREARRQKLRDLAETLRTDKEATADLRQAYVTAGYQLEERDGKKVWVYPHADLKAEKDAAYAARKEWDARRQVLKEQRLSLDRATEQETRSGIRHPQRSTWQAWRAQTLSRRYNPAWSAEMSDRDIYARWMPEHGGLLLRLGNAEVIDQGPLILAKNGTDDIPLMIDTAQGKGWTTLEFTGSVVFQEQAAMAALRAGLKVADQDLARRAREAIAEQARVPAESPPSSEVKPGIRYVVEETADHVPYRDKHGEVMWFDSEADASDFRRILGGKYPIVPVSVVKQEPAKPEPIIEAEKPVAPIQEPIRAKPKPVPVQVPENSSPDLTALEARRQKLVDLAEALSADVATKMVVRKAYLAAGYAIEQREWKSVFVYPPGDLPEARKAVTLARKDWNNRRQAHRTPERVLESVAEVAPKAVVLSAQEQERRDVVEEILFMSAPERANGLTERWAQLERKYTPTASVRREVEQNTLEEYTRDLGISKPLWAGHLQQHGGMESSREQYQQQIAEENKKWFKDKKKLGALTSDLNALEGLIQDRDKAVRDALSRYQKQLEADWARIQKYWPDAELAWKTQRSSMLEQKAAADARQREEGPALETLEARGRVHQLRRGWKGQFTGEVLVLDDRHVYIGRSPGEMIGIPKVRFGALPPVGLVATFYQGDAQTPATWGKVKGIRNEQGILNRPKSGRSTPGDDWGPG